MMRNMLSSLVLYEKLITTKHRAKMLKSESLSVINKIKKTKDDMSRVKLVNKIFYGGAVKKIIDEIDGYKAVRTYDYKARHGDGSIQTIIEIEKEVKKASKKDSE